LKASASASQLVGILALGLVLAASRASDGANRFSLTIGQWSLMTIAFGLLCGALFWLFIGHERDRMRIFLATIGLVTLASGVGEALGVSPMFINLLAGVTVAALSPHASTLQHELRRLEQPLRVIVMVFVGALWLLPPVAWWLFALVVFFLRWGLKRIWTHGANNWVMGTPLGVRKLGDGMLSQGTVAAAIGASFAQQQVADERAWILTTVLVVALLSEIISEARWRALLYSAGEADEATSLLGSRSSEL
jgi:Kef-type K+ transport system membrane component KefB